METAFEHILVSCYKDDMITYVKTNPEAYTEAIQLAVSEKQPYSWRAAWLLWSCMDENDPKISPFIKTIIHSITTKKDGHQRELLKILSRMELDEEDEGILFNICSTIWEKTHKNPSVRFTALKFLIKIAQKHPDLFHEINFLTQNHYLDSLSPGIKKSISEMLTSIKH